MVERIYDSLRGILWLQFPKNSNNKAIIYDREIKHFFEADRGVIPDNLSIVVKSESISEKDVFFGWREVNYNFRIILYSSADDLNTTVRVATEGMRLIRNILSRHKRIWVMDLCPICAKLPTSPEHFFVDATHQNIFGLYGTSLGPTGVANTIYQNFIQTWNQTHYNLSVPGNLVTVNITQGGTGYTNPSVTVSNGGIGSNGASVSLGTTAGVITSATISNPGQLYTALPLLTVSDSTGTGAILTPVISKPSNSNIAILAFNNVLSSIQSGNIPSGLNQDQINNFNSIIQDGVTTSRLLYDVQINSINSTDEADSKAFFSKSDLSLTMKELVPVTSFGPNFTSPGYDPQVAYGKR